MRDAPVVPGQDASRQGRLLDAAEALFAEQGFRATSIRDITARAACNVAAISYYFGGKERLYEEVYRRLLKGLREFRIRKIEEELRRAGPAADLDLVLRTFVDAFLEPLVDESRGRATMELMVHEMLDPHLPAGMLLREMVGPVRDTLVKAFVATVPGLSPELAAHCVYAVVGQLLHLLQVRRMAGGCIPGADLAEDVELSVRFSLGGIRAIARHGEAG